MRAVVIEQTGGPEVLQVKEIDTPQPGPGQVLVDVAAAGVNFIDAYQRTGIYPMDLPFVAGSEGAGTVSAVGPDVSDLAVGDRVAWAMVNGAGYAEQVVVPTERAVPVPAEVDLETAAAAMLQGMTAQYLCEATHPAHAGETALVHAAAGGVGLLLTQMLAAKGVRVIGTTSTDEKAALARGAGAAEVVAGWRIRISRRGDGGAFGGEIDIGFIDAFGFFQRTFDVTHTACTGHACDGES